MPSERHGDEVMHPPAETFVAEVRVDPTGVVFDDLGDRWLSSDTVVATEDWR